VKEGFYDYRRHSGYVTSRCRDCLRVINGRDYKERDLRGAEDIIASLMRKSPAQRYGSFWAKIGRMTQKERREWEPTFRKVIQQVFENNNKEAGQ